MSGWQGAQRSVLLSTTSSVLLHPSVPVLPRSAPPLSSTQLHHSELLLATRTQPVRVQTNEKLTLVPMGLALPPLGLPLLLPAPSSTSFIPISSSMRVGPVRRAPPLPRTLSLPASPPELFGWLLEGPVGMAGRAALSRAAAAWVDMAGDEGEERERGRRGSGYKLAGGALAVVTRAGEAD